MKRVLASLIVVFLLSSCAFCGIAEESVPITVTYLTTGVTPAALEEVQTAVNQITVPEIGVEVTLVPMSAYDAIAQLSTKVMGGDDLDLVMLLLQNVKTWADMGLLEPLNELLIQNAPYISQINATVTDMCAGTYMDGQAYGLTPVAQSFGSNGGFVIAKDYLDEIRFEYDENKIYTLDEIHDVLAAIKKAHPEMYPNGTLAQGTGSMSAMTNLVYDQLGASVSSGVVMGLDSTAVVNLFATPEYEKYVRTMRQWYLEGLSYPDAAVTSSTVTELVSGNVAAGYFMGAHPSLLSDMGGHEMVAMQTGEPVIVASGSTGSFWAIPMTCSDPVAAAKLLNLIYSNHDLSNLITWGIEGEHYVMLDKRIGLIGFPEGVDPTTSTYYNTLGLWGDRRFEYIWNEKGSQERLAAYTERAVAHKTAVVGYCYDTTATSNQIAAIQSIVAEYVKALESGSVDTDTVLPEFISRLEAAGINDVIADNQAQLNAWLAAR